MNKAVVISLVIVVIVIVGASLLLLMQRRRTRRLHARFGPEYDRALKSAGDRRKAEAELEKRESRVDKLDIRPLDPAKRERFAAQWMQVQSDFVDDPKTAIRDADKLIGQVMSARGYPVENFEQVADDISVDHPSVVQRYRTAHGIVERHSKGEGDTEDLREAMINYRPLFDELVSSGEEDKHDPHARSMKNDRRTRAPV